MAVPATRPVETAAIAPARKPSVKASTISGAVFDTVAFPDEAPGRPEEVCPPRSTRWPVAKPSIARPSACNAAANAIKASFSRTAQSSIRDRLNAINATVNRSNPVPAATRISTGPPIAGPSRARRSPARLANCEDFAILKMAALHRRRHQPGRYGTRHPLRPAPRVSTTQSSRSPSATPTTILDNMRDDVLADAKLPDYLPLYSIVDGRGFFHGQRVASRKLVAGAAHTDRQDRARRRSPSLRHA